MLVSGQDDVIKLIKHEVRTFEGNKFWDLLKVK
jgi:hypothetical protein